MNRIIAMGMVFLLLGSSGIFAADDAGFVSIFNGKDLIGWKDQGGFEVVDGVIMTSGKDGKELYTEKSYGNYILRLEFMLSDVGNSGIFIRTDPDSGLRTGMEIQLLAPWTPYRDDLHCTGSIYGHVAVINRPDETTGRWYKMEIMCDRKDITTSVNDKFVTHGNMDSVESMRSRNLRGQIGLQFNHSPKEQQWVKFRNISIRDLDGEPDYVIKGFTDNDPRIRQSAAEAAARLGPTMIGRLAALMSSDDPMVFTAAKQALFDIAAAATDPGAAAGSKEMLITVIQEQIGSFPSGSPKQGTTRDYLMWLMGMLKK